MTGLDTQGGRGVCIQSPAPGHEPRLVKTGGLNPAEEAPSRSYRPLESRVSWIASVLRVRQGLNSPGPGGQHLSARRANYRSTAVWAPESLLEVGPPSTQVSRDLAPSELGSAWSLGVGGFCGPTRLPAQTGVFLGGRDWGRLLGGQARLASRCRAASPQHACRAPRHPPPSRSRHQQRGGAAAGEGPQLQCQLDGGRLGHRGHQRHHREGRAGPRLSPV